MCKSRYFDCFAIVIAVLLSIVIGVLTYAGLIPGLTSAPIVALTVSSLSLLILTLGSTSLLRQDKNIDKCVCRKGAGLLISSIFTIIFSTAALLANFVNIIASAILILLIFIFFIYQWFALFSFLYCIITAGCPKNKCCSCDDD